MASAALGDGKVDGDTLSWTMATPKMTVAFEVRVAGDAMTGNAKLGMFGDAEVTGTRMKA